MGSSQDWVWLNQSSISSICSDGFFTNSVSIFSLLSVSCPLSDRGYSEPLWIRAVLTSWPDRWIPLRISWRTHPLSPETRHRSRPSTPRPLSPAGSSPRRRSSPRSDSGTGSVSGTSDKKEKVTVMDGSVASCLWRMAVKSAPIKPGSTRSTAAITWRLSPVESWCYYGLFMTVCWRTMAVTAWLPRVNRCTGHEGAPRSPLPSSPHWSWALWLQTRPTCPSSYLKHTVTFSQCTECVRPNVDPWV